MKLQISAHQVRPGDHIEDTYGPVKVVKMWRVSTGDVAIVVEDSDGNTERGYHDPDAMINVERDPSGYESTPPNIIEVAGDVTDRANRLSASLRMWHIRDLPGAPPKAQHAAKSCIDIIDAFASELERLQARLMSEDADYQARRDAEIDAALERSFIEVDAEDSLAMWQRLGTSPEAKSDD